MRWLLPVLLAACGGTSPHGPTPTPDAAANDAVLASGSGWWGTQVVVGNGSVAWSSEPPGCPIGPDDCQITTGPLVTLADSSGAITPLVTGTQGSRFIAGDDSGWFYTDEQVGSLNRIVAGGAPQQIASPGGITGVAVDDTYVYWAAYRTATSDFAIDRALRTGDGTDATTIRDAPSVVFIYAFAGDVWWSDCAQTSGCDTYRASSNAIALPGVDIVGADASALYVREWSTSWTLRAVASDGTQTTLFTNQPLDTAPNHVIVADGEVFWASDNGPLYRGHPAGAITAIGVASTLFAVTPRQILYNFTPAGYQAVAR